MKDRLKILAKFDNLQDEHCATCSVRRWEINHCHKHCDIGKEIKSLGEMLMQKNRSKTKEILAKGDKMTTSEVRVLREKGFTQREIAKSIGVPQQEIKRFFDELEKKSYQEESLDWRREDVKTRYEQTLKLIKENEDITANEISEKLGVTKTTASTYLSKARGQIRDGKNKKTNKKPVRKVTKSRFIEPVYNSTSEERAEEQGDPKVAAEIVRLRDANKKITADRDRLEKENKRLGKESEKKDETIKNLKQHHESEIDKYERDYKGADVKLQEALKANVKQKKIIDNISEMLKEKEVNAKVFELMKEDIQHKQSKISEHVKNEDRAMEREKALTRNIDDLSEGLYEREKIIAELRHELEVEQTKHSHLSNYTRLIMRKEGTSHA